MGRIVKIIIGLSAISYAIYSGNNIFFLGIIPLTLGFVNFCPLEKLMGGCKDGSCNSSSCIPSNKNENNQSSCSNNNIDDNNSSCCSSNDIKVTKFTAIKPTENTSCCSPTSNKVVIKILGTGCANCIALKNVVEEAIKTISGDFEVIKVEDIQEIMKYQVISTPGLVINEKVKSTGKLLNIDEVTALINGADEQKGEKITTKCCEN